MNRRMKFNARTQYRYGGVSLPLDMWAKRLGTTPAVLKRRLREGWSVRKTLSTPIAPEEAREDLRSYSSTGRVVTLFACRGERMSLPAWGKRLGLNERTVQKYVQEKRAIVIDGRPSVLKQVKLYTYRGETLSVAEWATRLGLTQKAFRERLEAGLLDEEIFKPAEKEKPPKEPEIACPYSADYQQGMAEGMWIVLTLVSTLMMYIPDAATDKVVRSVRAQLDGTEDGR